MLKSMNFKNDSPDERSQALTEALRLLDMKVYHVYRKNKSLSNDPNYTPRLAIYLGSHELYALEDLQYNNPELTNGLQYRGFPITQVCEEYHCQVFCLNPVVK